LIFNLGEKDIVETVRVGHELEGPSDRLLLTKTIFPLGFLLEIFFVGEYNNLAILMFNERV